MNTQNPTPDKVQKLLALFMLILFSSCGNESAMQEPSHEFQAETSHQVVFSQEQFNMAGVTLGKIVEKPVSSELKVTGIMHAPPQNLVTISAPYGGFVASTELLQGMRVSKGQVLAVLEDPAYVQLQQDFLEKKYRLNFLEAEFQRQKTLFDEKVNAEKTYQQAQSEYESMLAQVTGLEQKLAFIGIDTKNLNSSNLSRRISLRSPISGFITAVNVNIGLYVKPTDVLFEIVNTEHMHAELTVYEKDIMHVKVGQKIIFTLPNDRADERMASVYLIGRKINPDKSVVVHAHLDKEDHDLLPGMYIKAVIELDRHDTEVLPEEAVIKTGDIHLIYILKNKSENNGIVNYVFEGLEVEVGNTENGFTEVKLPESLDAANLEVVVKGAYSIHSQERLSQEEEGDGH